MQTVDCVIPAHEKDFETLGYVVRSLRNCCPEIRRIIIVSRATWRDAIVEECNVEWVDEAADVWPFHLNDFGDTGCTPGWIFQQLLKLHAPLLINGLLPNVLACDADVVWLQERLYFLQAKDGPSDPVALLCHFTSDDCPPIRSTVDLHRYDCFVSSMLPNLSKRRPSAETAVCHHALFQRDVIESLFQKVEDAFGCPFWEVFRDVAKSCGGRASEYELYFAYALQFLPHRVQPRKLAFAVVGDFEAALRSPPSNVAFFVAHSHLRSLSSEELRDREGIINGDTQAETLHKLTSGQPPELAKLLAASGMF